jgi:hypothetical protein
LTKKSKSTATLVAAIKEARKACADAGLDATYADDGEPEFTAFQTAKAVRHAREDVAATLMLQVAVLHRLDRNRNYIWVIIALLLYIAVQFK